jgi:hypothetical protein
VEMDLLFAALALLLPAFTLLFAFDDSLFDL